MGRPTLEPALLASLTEAAPARLVRKLDAEPLRAEQWAWSEVAEGWSITTDSAVVTLRGEHLATLEHVHCDCLLAPRCLHLLSVAVRLELVEGEQAPMVVEEPVPAEEITVDARQMASAASLFEHLVTLVDAGVQRCGTVAQGQLLRDAHRCTLDKLPRLAGAALRIARGVRALHERDPDFELPGLAAEVAEALAVAERLARGEPRPGDLGVSRRRYETLGGLKLVGLFCEPVLTRSGYAGVVTVLAAPDGRLHTVSDVRPGEPSRAVATYRNGADIGGASVTHTELCRSGLFVSRATASASGRLGRGREVEAVRAPPSTWPDSLFAPSLAVQMDGVLSKGLLAEDDRPEGWDLLFLQGRLALGAMVVGEQALPLRLPSDAELLRYRDNERVLAGFDGPVRLIGRWSDGVVQALALAPLDEGLVLDEALAGRVNLGLDRLPGAAVAEKVVSRERVPLPDPAEVLQRRLLRVLVGGARALPVSAGAEVRRETQLLTRIMLPHAAALLAELHAACGRGPSDTSQSGSPQRLAVAFSQACRYERSLRRHLVAVGFRAPEGGAAVP